MSKFDFNREYNGKYRFHVVKLDGIPSYLVIEEPYEGVLND